MNRSHCETWQGRMGFDALGKLSEREHEELVEHLSGCAACRQIHDELVETTAALSSIIVDPRQPEMAVSPALARWVSTMPVSMRRCRMSSSWAFSRRTTSAAF